MGMVDAVLFDWSDTLAHASDEEGESLAATTVALLESLRRRGARLALVTSPQDAAPEPDRHGLQQQFEYAATDGRVATALERLGVDPDAAVFVSADAAAIAAAARTGVLTVQALWFRADEHEQYGEPDFLSFTHMDVLNVVERLNRE